MPTEIPGGPTNEKFADTAEVRITLDQIRRFMRRSGLTIATVFVLTVVGAYASLSLMTELYEAKAALLVKLGHENLDPPATARSTVLSTGVRREELASEVQILRSPDLFGDTVDEIGVDAFRVHRVPPQAFVARIKYEIKRGLRAVKAGYQETLIVFDLKKRLSEREQAVAFLQEQFVAEPQKDSDVITLTLKMADSALAIRVQDSLIQHYMSRRLSVRHNPGVQEFLDDETRRLREKLARAEDTANGWKQAHGLSAPADQKALLLKQIRDLSADRSHAISEKERLAGEIISTQALLASASPSIKASQLEVPNPSLQVVKDRLAQLQADRAHLAVTYLGNTPALANLDEEITGLRALLQRQDATQIGSTTSQLNPLRQQLEQKLQDSRIALDGLNARITLQQHQLDTLQSELRNTEIGDAHLIELERERQIAEQNYIAAVKRLSEADVASELDVSRVSNVSIAMRPTAGPEPVYPRKLLIVAIALPLGLVLGLALALLLEWTSDDIVDPRHLEALTDLVYLGTVSFGPRRDDAAGLA
jgi:uncharacterized protein involved in exopolysaccharide biosynthesis